MSNQNKLTYLYSRFNRVSVTRKLLYDFNIISQL